MNKQHYKINYDSKFNPKDKSEYGTYYFEYSNETSDGKIRFELNAYTYDEASVVAMAEAAKMGLRYNDYTWTCTPFYTFKGDEYEIFKRMKENSDKDYDTLYKEMKMICNNTDEL